MNDVRKCVLAINFLLEKYSTMIDRQTARSILDSVRDTFRSVRVALIS